MKLFEELKRRNVIRVAVAYVAVAWLLIQVVETLFPVYGLSDAAIRVVVTVVGIGFVPALVLAWVFELTPEGLKRDAEVDRARPVAPGTGKLLDRIIIVVLALGLSYLAFDKFVLDPARDEAREQEIAEQARSDALVESYGDKSIAVLPFVNMSSDPDQVYFSDGISEELLNLLARIPELRVISRSSAFSFRGDDINVREVAEKLNVSHVLEGSVRKSGNRIRITAQLIEARTDTHLWSEIYDRELGDIFAIQDDIASIVVGELEARLLDEIPVTRKTHPEAYPLFLQARHIAYSNRGELDQSEVLLKRVLELDPEYAPAWTLLALVYFWQSGDESMNKYSREEGNQLFNDASEKALAVDPDDGIANAYLGWTLFVDESNIEGIRLVEKAVASEPNNFEVVRSAGALARVIGHFDASAALGQRAIDLNPLCHHCYWNLTAALLYGGRLEEAAAVARRRVTLFDGGWSMLGTVLLVKGEPQAALEAYETLLKVTAEGAPDPWWLHGRSMALHDLGRREESQESLAELEHTWRDDDWGAIAEVYAWTGDADAAFEWLNKRLIPGDKNFRYEFLKGTAWHPFYRKLHDDPRWHALWEATGTTQEELQAIDFNIDLPDP